MEKKESHKETLSPLIRFHSEALSSPGSLQPAVVAYDQANIDNVSVPSDIVIRRLAVILSLFKHIASTVAVNSLPVHHMV